MASRFASAARDASSCDPPHLASAPARVYWKITRSCGLACRQCRAEASLSRDPDELSAAEGLARLDRLAAFEPMPHVIFTGGDPLERTDLFELIAHARSLGVHVSVSPSATPRLTADVIRRLVDAGVEAISLSIDGATAQAHDDLRGVPGCFARTIEAAHAARDAGLMFQVNTLVSEETVDALPSVRALVTGLGAARWSLFFSRLRRARDRPPADLDGARDGAPAMARGSAARGWRADRHERPRRRTSAASRSRGGASRSTRPRARASGSATATASCSSRTRATSRPRVSSRSRRGTSARTTSSTSIGAPRSSSRCATRRASEGAAACAASTGSAAARARAWSATADPLSEDPLCDYEPAASVDSAT